MGRRLSIDGVGTDTTIAFFHWDGTAPEDGRAFTMSVIGILSSKANVLMSLFGTSSGPATDLVFTRESSRHISLLVTTGPGSGRVGRRVAAFCPGLAGRMQWHGDVL